MKKSFIVIIAMLLLAVYFPAGFGLVGIAGLVVFLVSPRTNKKKMTAAQKRKKFNNDIMYY